MKLSNMCLCLIFSYYLKLCKYLVGEQDRVSLCNSTGYPGTHFFRPDWPRTHEICLPLPSKYWDYKACATTAQLKKSLYKVYLKRGNQ